jgi:PhnB protein
MADEVKVKAVPKGYRTLTPYVVVRDAARAMEFYKKAFNAKELFRMPMPDGRIGHAEMKFGNSILMLSEEVAEQGMKSPLTLGGNGSSLLIYVRNVDRAFKRAVKAGCTAILEPADMFWGDRYSKLRDPFGHEWQIATHKEDLTPEQVGERMQKWMAAQASGQP